ncbi:unnamed protein product [Brassica oleracea var. botrytis]|uniref:(rape) hypothetical protein n=1 Tax=Brassica napus TaxID=3708 RepID=A0A816Q919_BRANA|nr:unnamed protein product [Brassica napus]
MDDEIMNNISETRIEDQTQIRESSYCHQEIGCCRKLRDKEAKHDMYGEVQRDPRACCIERRPALLQMQGNFAIVVNACNEGYNEENPAAGKRTKPILKKKEKSQLEDVKLPQGSESITVFGIDLPSENAGRVLQFLEFCSKFGKFKEAKSYQDDDEKFAEILAKMNMLIHIGAESPKFQRKGEGSCSIFKIPQSLKKNHQKGYEPEIVSIGPYDHGKEHLQMLEEHKHRYLKLFLDTFLQVRSHQNDRILTTPWILSTIRSDLLLLENQVPLILLNTLLKESNISKNVNLETLAFKFFNLSVAEKTKSQNFEAEHLLDLILFDEFISSVLLNCVAFEQLSTKCFNNIASYVVFMGCLMNDEADATYLSEKGIIQNYVGNGSDVSQFFKFICKDVAFDMSNSYLKEEFEGINNYTSNRWNVECASYFAFNTPDYFRRPQLSSSFDHIEKKRRIERRREEEEQQQDLEEEIERRRLGQLSDELCRIFFILGKQKKQPPFYMKRGENYKENAFRENGRVSNNVPVNENGPEKGEFDGEESHDDDDDELRVVEDAFESL